MVHAPGGDVFQVSTSLLRRVKKNATNLFHTGYGFYEAVVRLVVHLKTAIFHKTSKTAVSRQLSAFSQNRIEALHRKIRHGTLMAIADD
jgi:hypothetical protein